MKVINTNHASHSSPAGASPRESLEQARRDRDAANAEVVRLEPGFRSAQDMSILAEGGAFLGAGGVLGTVVGAIAGRSMSGALSGAVAGLSIGVVATLVTNAVRNFGGGHDSSLGMRLIGHDKQQFVDSVQKLNAQVERVKELERASKSVS
jgi:hypothetical protein